MLAVPQLSLPRAHASVSFTSPQAIELTAGSSNYPSSLQATDGTLWIAWQQYYETGVYETFSNNQGWSGIQTLPTGSQFTISPGLGQFKNGSIILLWSSNQTGRWNLYYRLYSYGVWHGTVQLTTGSSFDDFFPTVAVSTNSTVYVFWERFFSSASASVYYKTLKGNAWSGDIQLSSGNLDVSPTALATYDGMIWVGWSRLASGSLYNVYYRIYDGTTWSLEHLLTSSNYDIEPGLVQDRNGTIWIFWSRQMQLSNGNNAVYQQKLFYKYTYDGSSWSADTQLTFYGDVNTPLDDLSPSVVQGFDHSLWIFYSSDYPIGSEFDVYYIKSSALYPTHNVVMWQVQAGPYGFQKSISTVLVTVWNQGDYAETVQLTITATNVTTYPIVSAVYETVQAGKMATFTFSWNTTFVPPGRYVITASYPTLPGQSFLASGGDRLQYRTFTLLPPIIPPVCHLRHCPT